MTKDDFLQRLRAGLKGLPTPAIEAFAADYEAHFSEADAVGRGEAEVAAALGDPGRLARELRAETGLKAWQQTRTPATAIGAVFAVLGLGAIDVLILLPVLLIVGSVAFGLFMAVIACLLAGGAMLAGSPFHHGPGGAAGHLLVGLGLMTGSAAVGAVLCLLCVGLINALVWYGRLHFRLLKPVQP